MIKAKFQSKKSMIKLVALSLVILIGEHAMAQATRINLDSCHLLARQNFPLVKQFALIDQSTEFTLANADKTYLPNLSLNGQVSYQSDVTALPVSLPNLDIPSLSKDQYKIYGEFNQPVTELFIVKEHKNLILSHSHIERQNLEIELYQLKEKINELYFGILLIKAQLSQNTLMQRDLELGLMKLAVAVNNGMALQSDADNVKAALLTAQQQQVVLESNLNAFLKMLSRFINRNLDLSTAFETPPNLIVSNTLNRPELRLFELRSEEIRLQHQLLKSSLLPRFNFFMQVGYGRPALNFLSNNLNAYYIGGIRLTWNLTGFYTYKNQRSLLTVRQQAISLQEELFRFNNQVQLSQEFEYMQSLKNLIMKDREIIKLRENILETVKIQLANGTASANDYLLAVNAVDKARQNLTSHETQLIKVQYNYQVTLGL